MQMELINHENINNTDKKLVQNLVKNILKLFNKTKKQEKYQVLLIVADLISKKELRKNGYVFSNTMYKTAKRKINDVEIEDKIKYMPESKKKKSLTINSLIIDYLKKY